MADDPWTQAELDELADEWNAPPQKGLSKMTEHEARAYHQATIERGWFTAPELADRSDISDRSAREVLRTWTRRGIVEMCDLKPRRYKLADNPGEAAQKHATRLDEACAVLGLERR